MPQLMLFAPCERVSYDAGTSAATLVGIFQGFTVAVTTTLPEGPEILVGQEIPAHGKVASGLPIRWALFSLWRKLPSDGETQFSQSCELISPSGKNLANFKPLTFKMARTFHRNTMHIANFPIDEAGIYIARLTLRDSSDSVVATTDYPISVEHIKPEEEEGLTS